MCCRLSLYFWECRFHPSGSHIEPDPVPVGHAVCWTMSSRYLHRFSYIILRLFYVRDQRVHFSLKLFRIHCLYSLLQVSTVQEAQRRRSCVLQTLSEVPQEVPAYRTAYPAHLSTGVNLVRAKCF